MTNILYFFVIITIKLSFCDIILPSLPLEHYKYWFRNNDNERIFVEQVCSKEGQREKLIKFELAEKSHKLTDICSEVSKVNKSCWGYENDKCTRNDLYLTPECDEDSHGWARNKIEQTKVFFEQADFGYVRERKREIRYMCKPRFKSKSHKNSNNDYLVSSLECSQYYRFCRAKNIMINFEKLLKIEEPMRYRDDVIGRQQIGGWGCELDSDIVKQQGEFRSPLQSWFAELENYHVFHDNQTKCDLWLDKPTFIMKLDATVNMYHHFCDFINLYASLHLNNSFYLDNHILIWDTIPYRSNFGLTWQGFTKNPILDLNRLRGKKLCIKDVVFPLLPRMIYGIYYNMPLIPGCQKTGLFQAFNQHLLYRLNINQKHTFDLDNYVRVTLITRKTKYRQILNEDELLSELRNKSNNYLVNKYDFNHQMPFDKQIEISSNTDILIGIHGAGLTHCLFQPKWGVLFELYNCEDTECYKDLARLRGVKYITWENNEKVFPQDQGHHPDLGGAHAKFTNYKFDKKEFVRLVEIAVKHVLKERKKCNLNCNIHDEL